MSLVLVKGFHSKAKERDYFIAFWKFKDVILQAWLEYWPNESCQFRQLEALFEYRIYTHLIFVAPSEKSEMEVWDFDRIVEKMMRPVSKFNWGTKDQQDQTERLF